MKSCQLFSHFLHKSCQVFHQQGFKEMNLNYFAKSMRIFGLFIDPRTLKDHLQMWLKPEGFSLIGIQTIQIWIPFILRSSRGLNSPWITIQRCSQDNQLRRDHWVLKLWVSRPFRHQLSLFLLLSICGPLSAQLWQQNSLSGYGWGTLQSIVGTAR